MKLLKRLGLLALCLCLLLSAVGCGVDKKLVEDTLRSLSGQLDPDTAQFLVQNDLDALYHDAHNDEYLKLTNSTAEDVDAAFAALAASEADFFASYFDLVEITDEQSGRLISFFETVYKAASYTVGDPIQNDNGSYTVPVTVKPVDVVSAIIDKVNAGAESLPAYTDEEIDAMTDEEYETANTEYEQAWTELVVQSAEECADSLGSADETAVDMQVSQIDKVWQVTNESHQDFNAVVVYYPELG